MYYYYKSEVNKFLLKLQASSVVKIDPKVTKYYFLLDRLIIRFKLRVRAFVTAKYKTLDIHGFQCYVYSITNRMELLTATLPPGSIYSARSTMVALAGHFEGMERPRSTTKIEQCNIHAIG